MKRWLLGVVALAGTVASPAGGDDFEQSLNAHWIVSRPMRVHTIDSGDPAHGRVLALDPDGDDVYALVKNTEKWVGGAIEGDVRFTADEDNYLGIIYNFHSTAARTDFGVIYLKGNESYAQANPHYDFNVSRTLYPEFRVPLVGAAAIRIGEWQHFKLEVVGRSAHLYVGDMTTPQMTFPMFGGERGGLGLQPRSVGGSVWVDNVTWRPLSALSYSGRDRPDLRYAPQQMLTSWSVVGPLTEVDDEIARQPGSGRRGRPFAADPRGAVMTGTVTSFPGDHSVAYFRTRVASQTARDATLVFSTADDLALWVNGRFCWFVPRAAAAWHDFLINRQHGGQRIPIRLIAGDNDIVVRVRGGSYATGAFFTALDGVPTP